MVPSSIGLHYIKELPSEFITSPSKTILTGSGFGITGLFVVVYTVKQKNIEVFQSSVITEAVALYVLPFFTLFIV